MLALVRLNSPLLDVAQPIDDLPDPPALQWTAFLVHCDDVEEVLGLVDWTKRMRSIRPRVPVGVAFSKEAAGAVAVAARALPLEPLVETATARIDDEGPLRVLVHAAIEGRIIDEWINRWPASTKAIHELQVLATHAVRGAGLSRVCNTLGIHESTLYRRLAKLGLVAPSRLWSDARVRSVEIRRDYGIPLKDAVSAAGWMDVEDYRKASHRVRAYRDGSDPPPVE